MNDSVSATITLLIEAAKHGNKSTAKKVSKTKQIFNRLDQIEEALQSGVGRAALAEAYGWSVSIFDAALYRARRMRQAGGDRRIHHSSARPSSAPTPGSKIIKKDEPTPSAGQTSTLRKPL